MTNHQKFQNLTLSQLWPCWLVGCNEGAGSKTLRWTKSGAALWNLAAASAACRFNKAVATKGADSWRQQLQNNKVERTKSAKHKWLKYKIKNTQVFKIQMQNQEYTNHSDSIRVWVLRSNKAEDTPKYKVAKYKIRDTQIEFGHSAQTKLKNREGFLKLDSSFKIRQVKHFKSRKAIHIKCTKESNLWTDNSCKIQRWKTN